MNRIILAGKACCGKTHLKERFISRGYIPSISYTSRAIRLENGEVDGKDYHFVSKDEFRKLIEDGKLLEWEKFGDDYYGTPIDTEGTILIMSTDGIKQIPKEVRNQHFIIYLDIPREAILKRMKNRGWSDERIHKRLVEVDDVKFQGFTDYDLKITNSYF